MAKRALVIDGNSLVYRMYFASEMQIGYYKSKGLPPANAIKLMLLVMMKIISANNYDYALVAFDGPREELQRSKEFGEYKAGRSHMPDDLRSQLDEVQHSVNLLGMK
jgi:DNA polymerase-1